MDKGQTRDTLVIVFQAKDWPRISASVEQLRKRFDVRLVELREQTELDTAALSDRLSDCDGVVSFVDHREAGHEAVNLSLMADEARKPLVEIDVGALDEELSGEGRQIGVGIPGTADSQLMLADVLSALLEDGGLSAKTPTSVTVRDAGDPGLASKSMVRSDRLRLKASEEFEAVFVNFRDTSSRRQRPVVAIQVKRAPSTIYWTMHSTRIVVTIAAAVGAALVIQFRDAFYELIEQLISRLKLGVGVVPAAIVGKEITEVGSARVLIMAPPWGEAGQRIYIQVAVALPERLGEEIQAAKEFDETARVWQHDVLLSGLKEDDRIEVLLTSSRARIEGGNFRTMRWSPLDCKVTFSALLPQYPLADPVVSFDLTLAPDRARPVALRFSVIVKPDTGKVGEKAKPNVVQYTTEKMGEWFFSYATPDKRYVDAFGEGFIAAGHKYWVDRKDLLAGASFEEEITKAINSCVGFRLFWSRYAADAEYVKKEAELFTTRWDQAKTSGASAPVFLPYEIEEKPAQPWQFLLDRFHFPKFRASEAENVAVARELNDRAADPTHDSSNIADKTWDTQKVFFVGRGQHLTEREFKGGLRFRDAEFSPLMITIEGGHFKMGAGAEEFGARSNEWPQHDVEIAYNFAAGRFLITVGDWLNALRNGFEDNNPGRSVEQLQELNGRLPLRGVSWRDARVYTGWLSNQLSKRYRLLTEAEWEFCCRAGGEQAVSLEGIVGPITSAHANFDGRLAWPGSGRTKFRDRTTSVGSFGGNSFGLYDMHGNLWEWVEDQWHENYEGAPKDGSAWVENTRTQDRVARGGSFRSGAKYIRCASRGRPATNPRSFSDVGFRIARDL
jgi:formylglycine-generating enzyme required for sulfatase activity